KICWRKDYVKDLKARRPGFGFSDYPLVDGEKLICTPGGPEATIVALNKVTGAVLWSRAVPGTESAQYGAAVVAEIGGVRQYINFVRPGIISVSADGKLLWRCGSVGNPVFQAHAPIVRRDLVFCTTFGQGCTLLRILHDGAGFKVGQLYSARMPD